VPVADICSKAGISQATHFNWKRKYDGLLPNEIRRLKQLEDENAKLRKVVAECPTQALAPQWHTGQTRLSVTRRIGRRAITFQEWSIRHRL
jgi:hypothetical protein